jgi:hypothetical protein
MSTHEIQVGSKTVFAVDFEEPRVDEAGYVRPFQTRVIDQTHGVTSQDTGRLRFTFKGDRDNRQFIVLNEGWDPEFETWRADRGHVAGDANEAIDMMKADEQAGRLAISAYFRPDANLYGFPRASRFGY